MTPSPHIQVPGDGPMDCQICFIGEAPGRREAQTGKPFVGTAGELFDKLLNGNQIQRSRCRVTNVVKVQPENNDITPFLDLSKTHPEPSDSYLQYEDYLYDELTQCSANVIVPLGNISLYALTRKVPRVDKGITKWRGSILSAEVRPSSPVANRLNGRKVIPTIHPASVLRPGNYLQQHYISRDLQRIAEESKSPDIAYTERHLIVRPSFFEIMGFLSTIKTSCKIVAYDIEVRKGEVSCIAFAVSPTLVISIPFEYEKGDYMTISQEMEVWQAIGAILRDRSITKVIQYTPYDVPFIMHKYGIPTCSVEDTYVAHRVLYSDLPAKLEFMTSTLTREPYYKDEGKEAFKGPVRDWDAYWRYNAKDAAMCMEILPIEKRMLERTGNLGTYNRQMSMFEPLLYAQMRGMKIGLDKLKEVNVNTKEQIDKLQAELDTLVGHPLNVNSAPEMRKYFYIELGYKPYISRKTGGPTTDSTALRRLSRKGCVQAAPARKLRELRKLYGTYLTVELDDDGRLRGNYNPAGAETGRFSCKQTVFGTGCNMQNQMKEIKRLLLPDPGYVLFIIDLSQAENRIVAYITPEPTMRECFELGTDVHRKTASLLFGIPLDEVSGEDGSSSLGRGDKSQRFWGKQANHALNYDLGYKKFALDHELTDQEGKRLVERYHQVYPAIRNTYHPFIKAQLQKDRTITNPYGRRRTFLDRWDDNLFRAAYSHFAQGTVADKTNEECLKPTYYDQDTFGPVELLNQEHDAIWFQIPLSVGWDRISVLLTAMKTNLEEPVPWRESFVIPADVKMGPNIADVKVLTDLSPEALEEAYQKQNSD